MNMSMNVRTTAWTPQVRDACKMESDRYDEIFHPLSVGARVWERRSTAELCDAVESGELRRAAELIEMGVCPPGTISSAT